MAINTEDGIRQSTSDTGTGAFTPEFSITGFATWSVGFPSATSNIPYVIEAVNPSTGSRTGEWETGFGTWNGTSLVRDTVTGSSNSGSVVSFGAGVKLMSVSLNSAAYAAKLDADHPSVTNERVPTDNSVTASKIPNTTITAAKLSFTAGPRFMARTSAGAGGGSEITSAQLTASLDNFTRSSKGMVPPSGGTTGTTKFLREDGVFEVPPGSGGGGGGGAVSDGTYNHVTVSSSGTVWTINNDVVSNAILANMANSTFKGRVSSGTGDPEDLTATQVTAALNTFTSSLKGLVPSSGGGTTNFLRADGSWAAPAGGGGGGGSSGIQTYVFDPADKTGATDYTIELEALIRQANGLSADGTGTVSENPQYVYCKPGKYLLRNLDPCKVNAASTTTGSGTLTNGTNSITLADGSGFTVGANLQCKIYTNQGVYQGRYSRSSGSNTISFVPGQTGQSLAGFTYSSGARVEECGEALSMLLYAEPNSVEFMYYCNESAIFNSAAIKNQYNNTIRKQVRSIAMGPALDWFPGGDDTVCTILNVSDTTDVNPGDIWVIGSNNPLPYNTSDRTAEAFRVMNVDGKNIYAHGVLEWHYMYEAFGSSGVFLNKVSETVKVDFEGLNFRGAPTVLGIDTISPNSTGLHSDGAPMNVFGPQRAVTIVVASNVATVTTPSAHGLVPFISSPRVDGNQILIEGTSAPGLNKYTLATSTPTSTTFTYATSGVSNGTYSGTYRVAADCHSGITEGRAVTLSYAPYARLRNCEANFPWSAFIRNAYCPFTRIENCGYRNASNALSGTAAKARLGYGVYCYGWSAGTVVQGGTWIGGRHLFTTAAPSRSSWDETEWVYQGQPTLVTVQDTVSIDAYGVPYDTHEEASTTIFRNVVAINPGRGHDGGSYAGAGSHIRSRRSRFMNYYQTGGSIGMRFIGDSEGRVVAEAKPRPATALRPTTQTWPLSGASIAVWSTEGFTSNGTVYIEQQAGSGVYIACTYSNTSTSGGIAQLTGVSSSGAGTGNLETGAWVRQPNISSITISGSTATVTTIGNHGYSTSQPDVILRIRGADQGGYNVTVPVTITGATTFTYTIPAGLRDDNNQVITVPTVSATGTMLQWQDWSQYPTHLVDNVVIEDVRSRDTTSCAVILESCSNALKTEVKIGNIRVRNCSRGIVADGNTRVHIEGTYTAQLIQARAVDAGVNSYVRGSKLVMDASQNRGVTMTPLFFNGSGAEIYFNEIEVVFGRAATNASTASPLTIVAGSTGITSSFAVERLRLRDARNANITAAICPTLVPVTIVSTLNNNSGAEVLEIETQDNVVTNSTKTLGQRSHSGRFLISRAFVATEGNAVGNITVDVLRAGVSIFGTNKITIPSGTAASTTGTAPTLSATTSLILGDASLTVTAVSSSGSETAKINNVCLVGYWI